MTGKNQSGFTLVELIAASALMGLMVVGIVNLYLAIETAQRKSYHLEMATRAGEKQIESLRNSNYGNLTPDTTVDFSGDLPAELPNPKTGSIAITEPNDGIRRVDITITYKEGADNRVVKQSSLIGVLGIGQ